MIELISGFLISIISLLIGFNLGKHQMPFSPQVKKQLDEAMGRVIPNDRGVGAVPRLTPRELELVRNPKLAEEQRIMGDTFKEAISQS